MKRSFFFSGALAALWLGSVMLLRAAEEKHYLYLSTPDGAQVEGRSGNGILIFDIDDGHKFVRRIELPSFRDGLRGLTGSATNKCIYYSTTNRRLGCYNVEQDKVVWEKVYDAGCDRSAVSPDGKKIYVPTGWWYRGTNSGLLVVDAGTGEIRNRIPVGLQAHNSLVSLDGRYLYLGTDTTLTMIDPATDQIVKQFKDVGESGVFPFTVDSQNHFAYICLGKHVGFDMVDLQAGRILHRVFAGETQIPHRTHGAGLTPDESELWISDQDGKRLFIFDATQIPPTSKGQVNLSMAGHGWICFSLDGKYAWCHTPDVFDARTREKVATLRDEGGRPVCSSKFVEIHFRAGKVLRMGNEFALGRAQAAASR